MSITTTTLTRAAGVAAVVGGLLYATVQIGHPTLSVALTTTTEWEVRQGMKVLFTVLSLAGITGMYLRQVKQIGVLGLIGYLLLSTGFLSMLALEVAGAAVVPSIARTSPAFVSDVLTVATGGHPTGDIGLMAQLNQLGALGYLGGGVLFGIALVRATVLPRWAGAFLAVSAAATLLIPVLPHVNQRVFAVPFGAALICLGVSLWRDQRAGTSAAAVDEQSAAQLDPAGVR